MIFEEQLDVVGYDTSLKPFYEQTAEGFVHLRRRSPSTLPWLTPQRCWRGRPARHFCRFASTMDSTLRR